MNWLKVIAIVGILSVASWAQQAKYQYFRVGNGHDVKTKTEFGVALMGGGKDLDEAFQWMCGKSGGGDFLVIRAAGDDDYNPYIAKLCKQNSVATLIVPNREAATDPKAAEIIREAAAVFIAGGDQARYVNFWRGTPVEDTLNENIAEGKPIGGTSAGLAILGEFSYGALNDLPDGADLKSQEALSDPYFFRVTLARDFLKIPLLNNVITDSHFAKRDRMGRSLVFLARIMQQGWSANPREIAVDERSAVVVDADGKGTVVGSGKGAYFLTPKRNPSVCKRGTPLEFRDVTVFKAPAGAHFDLKKWKGAGGQQYTLSVGDGKIHSTQASGVY